MEYKEIRNYGARGSRRLNRALMSRDKLTAEIKKQECNLNAELDSLINHGYCEVFAHDGMTTIPFEILSNWYKKRIGKIIMFPNFLSTSSFKWKNKETVYKIKPLDSSGGKDVSGIIGNTGESEILFNSKSKFQIIGVGSEIELLECESEHFDIIMYEHIFLEDGEIESVVKDNSELVKNKIPSLSDLGEI